MRRITRKEKIGLSGGIFLFVFILFFLSLHFYYLQKEKNYTLLHQKLSLKAKSLFLEKKNKVLYIIDKGEGERKTWRVVPEKNETVCSLLQKLAKKENISLSIKYFKGMGAFVESIEGLKNGKNGKYWLYFVNGKLANTACDKMRVKKGDVVEWKFAPSPF